MAFPDRSRHFFSSASDTTHQETEEGTHGKRNLETYRSSQLTKMVFVPVDFGLETQLTDRRGKRRRKRSSFLSGFSMATVLTVRAATFQLLLYHLAVRWIWGMRGNRGAGRWIK